MLGLLSWPTRLCGVGEEADVVCKVTVTEHLKESPWDTFFIFCCILHDPVNTEREEERRELAFLFHSCLDDERLCQLVSADDLVLAVTVQHPDNIHYLGWYSVVSQDSP